MTRLNPWNQRLTSGLRTRLFDKNLQHQHSPVPRNDRIPGIEVALHPEVPEQPTSPNLRTNQLLVRGTLRSSVSVVTPVQDPELLGPDPVHQIRRMRRDEDLAPFS